MNELIDGNRYKYSIELEKVNNNYFFEILSQFKEQNRKSTITNVNFIISEIIFPIIGTSDLETTIVLNKKNGEKLFDTTISIFNVPDWIDRLEIALDEDREIGGWNSNFIL